MKRRRFSLEVCPGAVVLLSGLYFLLPLRWCARLALTVTVHELGHVAALILCGAQVCGLRMEGCGLVLRCTPPEGALRTVTAALAGPAAGAGLFCILLYAALAALAGERAAERTLDVLGLVLPVTLMVLGLALFARGFGLAPGVFGAWLALLQPGMTCQCAQHDVKYSYYQM